MNRSDILRSVAFSVFLWGVLSVSAVWAQTGAAVGGYAGSEACADCHDEVATSYAATAHGRTDPSKWAGWTEAQSCEACHGPALDHAESGDPDLLSSFSELSPMSANQKCLNCHRGADFASWHGSEHEALELKCADCHTVHQSWTTEAALTTSSTDTCLSCHQEQRTALHQRSGHPLKTGQMGCTSCHTPHGSPSQANLKADTVNDLCQSCHAETRGPFLYEHAPVRENCLTCHDAHASNNRALLVASAPRLCQSCHIFGHHQTVPGESTQVWNVNRSCVNCHSKIHGSNHPSGVIFMR